MHMQQVASVSLQERGLGMVLGCVHEVYNARNSWIWGGLTIHRSGEDSQFMD
jgi:hypothetical protein